MRYLVNRKTKEHQRMPFDCLYAPLGWNVVQADDDGWIKHEGNECPLPDDALCGAVMKPGIVVAPMCAHNFNWLSVVEYRPILEPEKVKEHDPRSVSFNLLDLLKAAHEHAQQIPDIEKELREVLASMGYDLVHRSPFAEPAPAVDPDMTDWRNWREGDELARINKYIAPYWSKDIYTVMRDGEKNYLGIVDDEGDFREFCYFTTFIGKNFRFHSRPAKGEK